MTGIETISAHDLDRYHGDRNVMIIDLRDREEYEAGHFDGAVKIPYEELDIYEELPADKILVLYCDRGSASLLAARELMQRGFRVKSVVGGFHAYKGTNLYFPSEHSKIK